MEREAVNYGSRLHWRVREAFDEKHPKRWSAKQIQDYIYAHLEEWGIGYLYGDGEDLTKTIGRMIGDMKKEAEANARLKIPKYNARLDEPFKLHMLDTYGSHGLSWEDSAFLKRMWVYQLSKPDCEAPTLREMRWYKRVHLANPAWNNPRVWFYSQRFIISEKYCHEHGIDIKADQRFEGHSLRMAIRESVLDESGKKTDERKEAAMLDSLRDKVDFLLPGE